MAGTKVKVIFSKMTAMENTARNKFNRDTENYTLDEKYMKALDTNSNKLNADVLNQLARKDLPLAIELMSKLKMEGILMGDTIQKIFTQRHALDAEVYLNQVGGNIDKLLNKITKGMEYTQDFDTQMFTFENNFKKFLNNIKASEDVANEFVIGALTSVLYAFNKAMENTGESAKEWTTFIARLGIGLGSLSTKALMAYTTLRTLGSIMGETLTTGAGIVSFLKSFGSSVATFLTNPATLAVLAVGGLVYSIYALDKSFQKTIIDVSNYNKAISSIENTMKSIEVTTEQSAIAFEKLRNGMFDVNTLTQANTIWGNINSQIQNVLDKIKILSEFDLSSLIGNVGEKNQIKFEIKMEQNKVDDILGKYLDKVKNVQEEYYAHTIVNTVNPVYKEIILGFYSENEEQAEKAKKKLLSLGKTIEQVIAEFNRDAGISFLSDTQLEALTKAQTKLDQLRESLSKATAKSKEYMDVWLDYMDSLDSSLYKIQDKFLKKGEIMEIVNDNITTYSFKGNEEKAIMAIGTQMKETYTNTLENSLGKAKSELEKAKKDYSNMFDETGKLLVSEEDRKNAYDSLMISQTAVTNIENELERVGRLSTKAFIAGLESEFKKFDFLSLLTKDLASGVGVMKDILGMKFRRITKPTLNKADARRLARKEENLINAGIVEIEQGNGDKNKKGSGKSNSTKYKIEYVKLLEKELELEKSITMIGTFGIQREALEYQYTQKKLANEYSELELAIKRNEIEAGKLGISRNQGELDKDFLDRLKTQKEYLESLGELEGEQGEKRKQEHSTIVKLYNSIVELQNKGNDIQREAIELMSKYVDKIKEYKYNLGEAIISYKTLLLDNAVAFNLKGYNDVLDKRRGILQDKIDDNLIDLIRADMSNLDKASISKLQNIVSNTKLGMFDISDIEDFKETNKTHIRDLQTELETLQNKAKVNGKLTENELKRLDKINNEITTRLEYEKMTTEQVKLQTEYAQLEIEQRKKAYELTSRKGSNLSLFGDFISMLPHGSKFGGTISQVGSIFSKIGNSTMLQDAFKGIGFLKTGSDFTKLGQIGEIGQMASALGGSLGTMFGGDQQASQNMSALGSLGGMAIAQMMGASLGPAGMIGGALLGLAGGLMTKNREKDRQKAQERTEKANRDYQANTNAIHTMVSRLEMLNTTIVNFNKSMVGIFSNIPTIDNISRIEKGLGKLHGVINTSRDFGSASYLTQHSKTSGNWLSGKSTVTWLENTTRSTAQLVKDFGFKQGTIMDMSIKQLEDFSKWLKAFNVGVQNNYKDYAKVIDGYVESLISLNKSIEKFSYNVTMEAFSGISVQKQEDLVNQLTDIYKNAGITITEGITKQIQELAEEMSVMVNVMEDVRKGFLSSWNSQGQTAGKTFVNAMRPYVEAMLNNMQQVYFDTVFSNSTRRLELQFKNIADKLFELKKLGKNLTWEQIYTNMKQPFSNVVNLLKEAQMNTDMYSKALIGLQQTAKDLGMSISEMADLNILTGVQQNLYNVFKESLNSNELNSSLTNLGNTIGNTVGEYMSKSIIDKLFGDRLSDLSSKFEKTFNGNLSLTALSELSQVALSTGLQLESERLKLTAIRDMFDFNKDINYQNQNNEIKYETGTSQTVINNFYLTSSVNAGVVIPQDTVEDFVDSSLDSIIDKLKIDKGIDLTKIK